ncbi:MAG: hypothetical protein JWO92_1678 [Chitinophagaceae bacterium]|nr:hypothetical protein [Chitinophagaceae bacterium]
MRKTFFAAFIIVILFNSCSVTQYGITKPVAINSLKYLGEYIVPYNQSFKGTSIGGLSGIDYDPKSRLYYLICDDRSQINPARFYTAKISFTENGISNVEFVNVTTLLQPDGTPYPDRKKDPAHSPDPEAMRYNPVTNKLVWTSEGERIVKNETILEQPAITIINKEGKYIDTFPLPLQTRIYATEKGLRQNSVFEGLAYADNFKTMYISVEEPLYEDGPRAGLQQSAAYTRIIKYDATTHIPGEQYAYLLEPVGHAPKPANEFMINGIPDILSIGKNKLLVIERSFSTGIQACTIRVYITDLSNASNISELKSLREQSFKYPAAKKLLINMDDLGIYIDNIEGVTFGPDLPNGHHTLIFVSDNNFAKEQKTQFLLFEVN